MHTTALPSCSGPLGAPPCSLRGALPAPRSLYMSTSGRLVHTRPHPPPFCGAVARLRRRILLAARLGSMAGSRAIGRSISGSRGRRWRSGGGSGTRGRGRGRRAQRGGSSDGDGSDGDDDGYAAAEWSRVVRTITGQTHCDSSSSKHGCVRASCVREGIRCSPMRVCIIGEPCQSFSVHEMFDVVKMRSGG